jgi:hypothetical protein
MMAKLVAQEAAELTKMSIKNKDLLQISHMWNWRGIEPTSGLTFVNFS